MEQDREEFPSLPEQGKNLTKFIVEVVKDAVPKTRSNPTDEMQKMIFTSAEEQQQRLEICYSCPYFAAKEKRCKKCGCWLAHKVKFKISECPILKWGKIE